MKNKEIVFPGKNQAKMIERDFPVELPADGLLVQTKYSAISAGTELANYQGLPNTQATGFRSMTDNVCTGYPIYPGYSLSGVVIDCGKDVSRFRKGDCVVLRWHNHKSYNIAQEKYAELIPDGVSFQEAAFHHISIFPCLGVRKLQLQLGESCMIAGLGILGLFALQFARLSGAYPVFVCDPSKERRDLAMQLGADYAFDPTEPDFLEKVKAATDGKGPDGVVEVTGRIEALQQALEYIAWQGRITLLGCTRISDKAIDFYKYVHKRGISIIGAHTATRPTLESRPGQWTESDDTKTFLKLVKAKRLLVSPLIHRIVTPEQAGEIYHELAFSNNAPIGVLFDWTRGN